MQDLEGHNGGRILVIPVKDSEIEVLVNPGFDHARWTYVMGNVAHTIRRIPRNELAALFRAGLRYIGTPEERKRYGQGQP